MENLKSVIYLKKDPRQSQEEFKNACCTEYNYLLGEFFIEKGAYYDLYAAILKNAGENNNISDKVSNFADNINPWLEMANEATELPVPNFAYFRKIYYDYRNSKKSPKDLDGLATRLFGALNEVTIASNDACGKFFKARNNKNK